MEVCKQHYYFKNLTVDKTWFNEWQKELFYSNYTCPNPTLLKMAYVILFLKISTSVIPVGSVSVGEHVFAVGKVTVESWANPICGLLSNPSGGGWVAPVANCKMFSRVKLKHSSSDCTLPSKMFEKKVRRSVTHFVFVKPQESAACNKNERSL